MKGMSSAKEVESQQHSYFYVVWPEDKSPGGTVATTVSSTASSAVPNSTPPLSTATLPAFNYETQTLTTSSSGSSSSSLQHESPLGSPVTKETVTMASVQVLSNSTASPSRDPPTKLTPESNSSVPVHSVHHITPSVASTVGASSTFVIPSLDSFMTVNSVGRQRSVLTPDQTASGKQRFHPVNLAVDSNLKEIGTLAKQAMVNLKKIVLATGSSGSGSGSVTGTRETPPSKRRRVWEDNADCCMECEVKDAEINILRKRIQTMQEQAVLPNGNGTVQSHVPPPRTPPEELTPHIKPLVGHIQESVPQLTEQHQILLHHHQQQQQQQQQQQLKASPAASLMHTSDSEPAEQSSSGAGVTKQSNDYVELVAGSGVYIPAYKLEEATRDAKTGTQLARKLMDAFWDKDTLAKSTLTPRSKFQYQQLDPKVIKSIEAYCLSHDSTLHSKDIHATMTDKCCQARSRYRSLNPHIYNSE